MSIWGRRREMVRVDGFKSGNLARFAFDQSIKALESRFAQKARSSRSDLNFGILVFISPIAPFLIATHIAGGNNPKGGSANGENHEYKSGSIGLTESVIPRFTLGVFFIVRDKQRRIKEDLFAFRLGDAMFEIVLLIIALIPLKLGAAEENFVGIIH